MLTSVPFGAFLLLLGVFWVTKPIQAPPDDAEDPEAAHKEYRRARRRQAFIGMIRLMIVTIGGLILLGSLVDGVSSPDNAGAFALLTLIYGSIILLVQRSEVNRRLATLGLSLLLWLIVIPRYADYRGWHAESDWAIYAALLLNYLFWLFIGRRYPPHSSQDIYVWGMDD